MQANSRSYDNNFSSISLAMQGPDIADLFGTQVSYAVEADKAKFANIRIKLDVGEKVQRFRLHMKPGS